MNWLETLFGLAPDGGNGATELLILSSAALLALAAFGTRALRRRLIRQHS